MISIHLHIFLWRKFVMYKSMKTLIQKHFYKDGEAAQKKLDVFYAVNRLTDDEFTELTALAEAVYGGEAA